MKTATLLEVMAEVGAVARRIDGDMPGAGTHEHAAATIDAFLEAANCRCATDRRAALLRGAATAIVLLHAHDAEAAKAGAR